MTHVAAIGTYLPCWGSARGRVAGGDEDAVTLAVEAGRAAIDAAHGGELAGGDLAAGEAGASGVQRVVLVSRELPLLEGGNAAVLLAGLGLDPEIEMSERLGGAPAALDALTSARSRTLVIAADVQPFAGAAAALVAGSGLHVVPVARLARSLPVRTRSAAGEVHDYGDPRLLRERGVLASLATLATLAGGDGEKPLALAGVDARQAAAVCAGQPPALPTTGASSALFALAALAESGSSGPLFAAEQATVSGVRVGGGGAVGRGAGPAARPAPPRTVPPGKGTPVCVAASGRAFRAKVRFEAGRQAATGELDFPPRYRVGTDGTLHTDYTLVPLPRTGTVYTGVTVRIPVPGLLTPYSLVIVELDEVGVRVLAPVTGAAPGTAQIGDRGRMVLRRVAVRSGVPDYGYAFCPQEAAQTGSGA